MSFADAKENGEMLSEAECIDLLRRTPLTMLYRYINEYTDETYETGRSFQVYMNNYRKRRNEMAAKENKLYWNDVFERAGVSNTYGYKLVSGCKQTLKRDTILRICFACGMNYYEAEEALRCAFLPSLRVRDSRDAVIISAFCRGITDPAEVTRMLEANGQRPLDTCCAGAGGSGLRQIG